MDHRLEARIVSLVLYGGTALVLIFFYVPIFTLIVFSFHEGRYPAMPIDGWSLKWYWQLFATRDFLTALGNTATIAIMVTIVSTIIATGGALAWARLRFRLKRAYQVLTAAPLLFPQLLLGIVLLLWFSILGNWFDFGTGPLTVVVGHLVYLTPFAMLIITVQVHNLDPTLEDAARDCGASTWEVYREITLPLMWPGIFSAGIFVLLLSWGNFYITYSLAGTARTLPTFIYSGIALGGSSPIYPALATVIFIPGLLLVFVAERYRRRAMHR